MTQAEAMMDDAYSGPQHLGDCLADSRDCLADSSIWSLIRDQSAISPRSVHDQSVYLLEVAL